jgi:hypothetical protein
MSIEMCQNIAGQGQVVNIASNETEDPRSC